MQYLAKSSFSLVPLGLIHELPEMDVARAVGPRACGKWRGRCGCPQKPFRCPSFGSSGQSLELLLEVEVEGRWCAHVPGVEVAIGVFP